jgi:hypothetical protein
MLAQAARSAARVEALVDGGRRLDYAGYAACVAAFARELRWRRARSTCR